MTTHPVPRQVVPGCSWDSATFLPWDDGHVPVHLRHGEYEQTLLVQDPHQQQQSDVHVVDDSVHESLVDAIYQYTTQQTEPWGAYVRIEQIQEEWRRHDDAYNDASLSTRISSSSTKKDMFIKVAAAYLQQLVQLHNDSTKDAHGIALWGLAANEGSQVTYHLDYAEQLRYEYNIIVPPIWAGTLQCSQVDTMQGGNYCVHTGGLLHYEIHGFKGKKCEISFADESCKQGQWLDIPYRYSRMILQRGHLPHLSTRIESLPPGMQRVIVGFNVFRHDVGPFVERAPEHSAAFRRRVALQSVLERNLRGGHSLSLESVRSNPALVKLLVQAKRKKVKDDLLCQQRNLDERIDVLLKAPRKVSDLIQCLARQDGEWPNADDVHVHIHHRCKEGRWLLLEVENNESNKGLISQWTHITRRES